MPRVLLLLLRHPRYLRDLLRHKLWVLKEGRRLELPWGQLLRHDLSKFRPDEWFPSVRFAYGPHPLSPSERVASERALALHHRRNPHHPESWVRHCEGGVEVLAMPDRYRREMLADWRAVGRAKGGSTRTWYLRCRDDLVLHPETRAWIEERLGLVPGSP